MIDTLRFADRLKRSGFENDQAEGMARALGDEMGELTGRVATKPELNAEVGTVRSDIRALDARVDALDTKVDALAAKVDALAAQIRFVLASLAVLLALGLIDTVPRLMG